jgi:murein DD-endopeptidase
VVRRGDVIGLLGNTGKSTGPHLDYELFQGQQRLNPSDWIYRKTS